MSQSPNHIEFDTKGFSFVVKSFVVGMFLFVSGGIVLGQVSGMTFARTGEVGHDAEKKTLSSHLAYLGALWEREKDSVLLETPAPRVSAKAFLVGDITTGEVLLEKNAGKRLPIASVTKLMTALISEEKSNEIVQPFSIPITQKAVSTYGTQGNLRVGQKMTVEHLLQPLLLESSNDAGEALALFFGRDVFLDDMNSTARSLGMSGTHFDDATGLSDENISNSRDLFKLTRFLFAEKTSLLDITQHINDVVTADGNEYLYFNHHPLKNHENFRGGKNGFTNSARKTLVTVLEVPKDKDGASRTVAIIILGSEDHSSDTLKLLSWLESTEE